MAVSDALVFPGFLKPVLTQLSFQNHQLLSSHASVEVGERRKYAGKKVCLSQVSNSQPPGHESDTLTTEPHCHSNSLVYVCASFDHAITSTIVDGS